MLSPIFSLSCGFTFTLVVVLSMYGFGFYNNNNYFRWGPPVYFLDNEITSPGIFYGLLVLLFFNELITNWVYEVVVPWIINTIQNPKNTTLNYSKKTCLTIIIMNSLYNKIHLAFVISGISSQISFWSSFVLAELITLLFINWKYIKDKVVA